MVWYVASEVKSRPNKTIRENVINVPGCELT
jgi:hypothetical protein